MVANQCAITVILPPQVSVKLFCREIRILWKKNNNCSMFSMAMLGPAKPRFTALCHCTICKSTTPSNKRFELFSFSDNKDDSASHPPEAAACRQVLPKLSGVFMSNPADSTCSLLIDETILYSWPEGDREQAGLRMYKLRCKNGNSALIFGEQRQTWGE